MTKDSASYFTAQKKTIQSKMDPEQGLHKIKTDE